MPHFKYINLILILLPFISGCSLDGLLQPDDPPDQDRLPRERRDPNPGEENGDPEGHETVLFIPLNVGTEWTYGVQYKQESKQQVYTVRYAGEERWQCTQARYSDSTFVFQTTFVGEKTILSHSSTQSFYESSSASVTARIRHRALIVLEENGESISPFLGDWLYLMDSRFLICFSDSGVVDLTGSASEFDYDYRLDQKKGLLNGHLTVETAYDVTKITYELE